MNTQIGFPLWARRYLRASAFLVPVLLVVSLLVLAPAIGAADYTVSDESELIAAINGANSAGSGTHTIDVATSITLTQNLPAFDNSNATVIVLAGRNSLINCGAPLENPFKVSSGTTVKMAELIIADCTTTESVIVNEGALSLETVELVGNVHAGNGAIYNAAGASLTLVDSVVSHNDKPTGPGGGIYNDGTLTIEDSTLSANRAGVYDQEPLEAEDDNGGAVYSNGVAFLRRVTIADNSAHYDGGGIFNSGDLLLEECTVDNNAAGNNGAGIDSYGSLQLIGGRVSDNNAGQAGAGVYNHPGGDAVLDDVEVFRNGNRVGTYNGGGVVNAGVMQITNSTIYDNQAFYDGGGLIAFGTVTVRRSTIADNLSEHGGGIYVPRGGTLTMYNSTLSGNYSFLYGGIYGGGVVNLQHVTVTDNSGGGVVGGELNMSNTIIANTVDGPDCAPSTLGTNLGNLVEDGSCHAAYTGDPLLAPLALNAPGTTQTHALLEGSPAIDHGDPVYCLNADQRGATRPQGAGCDIGAFESPFSTVPQVLVKNGEFNDGFNSWQKNPTHSWVQVKDSSGDKYIATWPWKGYTIWQDGIAVSSGKTYRACAEMITTTTYPYQVNLRLREGGAILGLDRALVKGNNCFDFTATKTTTAARLEVYFALINTPGTRLDFDSISLTGQGGTVPPTPTNTPVPPPTSTPVPPTPTNTPSPSAELLLNGGFDDNFLYWSKAPTHDWVFVRRSGDNKYIATYPWNGYKVYQSGLNIATGQGYTACAELFTDTTYSYQVNLRLTNGTDVIGLDRQLAEGNNCFSFTATQSTGSGQLELYFSSLRTGGTLLNFDDLSLTKS